MIKNYKMALLMILLILSLPIYSAQILAQTQVDTKLVNPIDGNELLYVGPETNRVHAQAEIYTDDINPSTIIADFSSISSLPGQQNRPPSSVDERDNVIAAWQNIGIVDFQQCNIPISFSDTTGNSNILVSQCLTELDNTPPQLRNVLNGHETGDGKPILGKNSQLIFIFEESQSGLNKNHIFVDFSSVGNDERRLSCESNDNIVWTCITEDINPRIEGDHQIIIQTNSEDDIGNKIVSAIPIDVFVDIQNPQIIDDPHVEITQNNPTTPAGYATPGDVITIFVNTTDGAAISANFSEIGDGIRISLCNSGICSVDGTVTTTGAYQARIPFSVFDLAGNKIDNIIDVPILGTLQDANPNYWGHTVTVSPAKIDRFVLALQTPRAYAFIHLNPTNPQAKTVSLALGDISGCTGDFISYVNPSDLQLFNTAAGSRDPVLSFSLAVGTFPESISFTCPLLINTIINNQIVINHEQEDVTITLSFYDNELGNPVKNLEKKIDQAVDDADWAWGILKWLGKTLRFAEKICYIKTVITSIIAAINGIIAVLNGIGNIGSIFTVGVSKAATEEAAIPLINAESGLGSFYAGIIKFVNPLCDFVSCRLTDPEAKGFDESAFSLDFIAGGICSKLIDWVYKKIPAGINVLTPRDKILNVKESIVWSSVCFCLPGIVYNFEKLREIDCKYALCLKEEVSKGIPISHCDEEKHYLSCNYWWGQVFNTVPFSMVIEDFGRTIIEAITNPWVLISVAHYVGCTYIAKESDLYLWTCSLPNLANIIGEAVNAWMGIPSLLDFRLLRTSQKTYCDRLDEIT